jgi:hypothetical protein
MKAEKQILDKIAELQLATREKWQAYRLDDDRDILEDMNMLEDLNMIAAQQDILFWVLQEGE